MQIRLMIIMKLDIIVYISLHCVLVLFLENHFYIPLLKRCSIENNNNSYNVKKRQI
ncbi:hypothetical protein V2J09_000529 [Rumex salicifolius]